MQRIGMRTWSGIGFTAAIAAVAALTVGIGAADEREQEDVGADFVPRAQDAIPHASRTPEEALEHWAAPEGFEVELVASEPTLVNPVQMTIDEQGRFWIVESIEYPRHEPGPGEDRIRVLEDTTGDGKVDTDWIFADGLNIPSGIAVGHGGVWVSNAPDILFLQDTTGDGKADVREVVVTGFDRNDTHELPNSFTWGPDGWLYGLHGVFNYSEIQQGDETFEFSAAIFRIHPRTHEFQVFAEGTSNPWGLAFDPDGQMFISACVIDHLWHVTETGYYIRQAGAYPPHTWRIPSIVDHSHHMAAFCGLVYLDTDAYPQNYRDTLYMGNIHGGKLNADVLERNGSTYFARPHDDRVFVQANDVWHMPVDQKVGPDGRLYVLDWYDRYHCYQDALRDPEGVDRLHGRLWRVNHVDAPTPQRPAQDMGALADAQLIEHLHSDNIYHRETAQRLLAERLIDGEANADTRRALEDLVLADDTPYKTRMQALFTLVSSFELDPDFHLAIMEHDVDAVRAWGVRAAGNFADDDFSGDLDAMVAERALALVNDASPDVQLQVAVAAPKIASADAIDTLATVLVNAGDDPLIPHIVWQNLYPMLLDGEAAAFMSAITPDDVEASDAVRRTMPRVTELILSLD